MPVGVVEKNAKFGERLQGCFRFSMNGKAPPLDSAEMVALETYSWWMAKSAGTSFTTAGRKFSCFVSACWDQRATSALLPSRS